MLLPFDIARILPRGLLGFMDDEDEPNGSAGADEEQAPAANGLVAHDNKGPIVNPVDHLMQELHRRAADRAMQLHVASRAAANFLGRSGVRPPTYDPVTGTPFVSSYLTDMGRVFSENMPLPGLFGARPGGPAARAPVMSLPRSEPGFLFGGPQTETAEKQAYNLPRRYDEEAAQQPGSDLLFGVPQARPVEDEETRVYHLPPADDGSDEDSEESPEQKASKEWAAAWAKENWEAFCLRKWNGERRRCADKYSYSRDAYIQCEKQAFKRYSACLTDRDEVRQFTDDQANGGFRPKTPSEKRREKWKRPRNKS